MKQKTTRIFCKEAARILGISEQRVRKLCHNGAIGSERAGNAWWFDRDSVVDYGVKRGHLSAKDHAAAAPRETGRKVALSFFSGAMGLDLGIEEAGFEVRLACENDKFCRQTIAINRPESALIGDISDQNSRSVKKAAGLSGKDEIDLIVGGPPCQAFSTAGKRNGLNDSRGNVFLKFLDLAISLKPKIIVIENVRGLLSCPMQHRPHDQRGAGFPDLRLDELKGGALNFILDRLRRAGYRFSFNLYNAANFGSPQVRERVVIVCSRGHDEIPFLVPTHSECPEYSLPGWKTFRSAVRGIEAHHHIDFPESRLKYYRMLEQGQNWRDLPEKIQKQALGKAYYAGGGKTGFLRRIAWDKPSPTLVTHPAMPATDLAHPSEDRPLSIEEYKRVQEFPDDWELAGPLVQQYRQVGNAVPKSLGVAIGKLAAGLIDGGKLEVYPDFPYSRYRRTGHLDWQREFEIQTRRKLETSPVRARPAIRSAF